jgi:hypothetical protein
MLKRLLVAVSTVLVLSSARADIVNMLIPGPWSVGITLVRWITSGPEKVLYVEVVGEGASLDEARQQGYRLAVEHAVGTVVASETEVRNSRVARDEIITYAAGYIDRFEIVNQQQLENRIQLRMKIWVKPSHLANRLLNESKAAGRVDGGRISNQIQTLVHERKSGDRLLQSILTDYPRRAFKVELEKTRVIFDANRNGQLEVAFYLSWSPEYLDSLAEAITAINQRPKCGFLGCSNKATSEVSVSRRGFGSTTTALFDDNIAEQLIRTEMIQSQPTIRMTILDSAGNEQFKQCLYAKELDHRDHSSLRYVNLDYNKVNINGGAIKRFNTFVDLSRINSNKLDQINVSIVRGPTC